MKNTNQKNSALDEMNNLINGITEMSKLYQTNPILAIMRDPLRGDTEDDDRDDDRDVFG